LFAKLLPKRCGYILNHQVTRVVLSSAIFALSHDEIAKTSPLGVMPQFIGGLISGTVAELDDSLFIPIISHFAYDLILGAGSPSVPR
jgi:membrane protease YdiL (CAAX protease family)